MVIISRAIDRRDAELETGAEAQTGIGTGTETAGRHAMPRRLLLLLAAVIAMVAATVLALRIPALKHPLQDRLLERGIAAALQAEVSRPPEGGMRVFMCGTSSPLPSPDRAQACVAIQVDDRLFLVDAGAGSPNVAALGNLPLDRLQAIFITHFHSDHIAAIGDFNLMSWVAGRSQQLEIVGPEGVEQVVDGFNRVYALDRGYRVAHHGRELIPPALHELQARTIDPGIVLDADGLVVRAFTVNHHPVAPAVGYRFEYAGRAVAITGDTIVTEGLREAVRGVDLLLSDALSLPIVRTMERAAAAAGRPRQERIFLDIQDYHASTASLVDFARDAGVDRLALYHLVPAPRNAVMTDVFRRGLPDDVLLTDDGMTLDLPAGSRELRIGH